MSSAPVIRLPRGRARDRRVARVSQARGRAVAALDRIAEARERTVEGAGRPYRCGRAWINGREAGGPDARYAHLARSHD